MKAAHDVETTRILADQRYDQLQVKPLETLVKFLFARRQQRGASKVNGLNNLKAYVLERERELADGLRQTGFKAPTPPAATRSSRGARAPPKSAPAKNARAMYPPGGPKGKAAKAARQSAPAAIDVEHMSRGEIEAILAVAQAELQRRPEDDDDGKD